MSTGTSDTINGTSGTIVAGPNVIQKQDFYVKAGILHPVIVGSIAIAALFIYLRLGSNRSIAPLTVFDWIINVAMGSTLAGIVNGTALARGLIALATLLAFQFLTSHIAANYKQRLAWLFQGPPLVVCFRGRVLTNVMHRHRISSGDINGALRSRGILNICLVECMAIEPNGNFSVFTAEEVRKSVVKPETLMVIPGYAKMCEKEGPGWIKDDASECNA